MGGACGTYLRQERCIKDLVGKPEGKKPRRRPRPRWDDIITMDVQEVEWGGEGIYWIDLAEDREMWRALVNEVVNLRVPWSSLSVGSSFNLVCAF
jgi:hypothetical protein